jgi:hypothetical protein
MSDAIMVKGTVDESADSPSFWRKIFLGSRGIRSGWRLTIFLLILAGSIFGLFTIGILRIPAAARIFHQGFLSPGLEYLTEIPAAICLLVCGLVMARIEKRGLGDYGLSLRRGASKHFLWGLFWGLCVFSGVIALIAALHGFSFGGLALHGLALLKYASLWAIGFLLVGFVEEFLYRGLCSSHWRKALDLGRLRLSGPSSLLPCTWQTPTRIWPELWRFFCSRFLPV